MEPMDVYMTAVKLAEADGHDYEDLSMIERDRYAQKARSAESVTYVVAYEIPTRPKYAGASTRVTLTNGYTVFEDIRNMIAIKRGVDRDDIKITSLALLAN